MKDHVQSCRLTKFDAFRVNRDKVIDLETLFKFHTNVCTVRQRPQNPYNFLKCVISFVTTVKSCRSVTI